MDYCKEYDYLKDEDHLFKPITPDDLIHLLDTLYTGVVYIGGPWNPKCQAVIDLVNNIGKKRGLSEIYNMDTKFINVYGEEEDIRDCKSLEVKLKYYEIVEKMHFKSDELCDYTLISKMHCPFFLGLKHGNCVGYFSCEYKRDGVLLYDEGSNEDRTIDFADKLIDLINKTQDNRVL